MASLSASQSTPYESDKAAMLHIVHAFLGCVKSRDAERMQSLALSHGSACLHRPHRQKETEQPMIMTIKQAIDRVFELTKPENEADEQSHSEIIHVDPGAEFGCVWAPYKFFERGEQLHEGSIAFSMVKIKGEWLISAFSDVARLL